MDLRLFGRVVWRFRVVVGAGLLFAFLLAAFSLVRVGPSGVHYRSSQQWVSYTRLFVTQPGFNWGSSVVTPDANSKTSANQANVLGVQRSSEDRLSYLATIYANLANSDPVLALIRRHGPIHGLIEADPIPVSLGSQSFLPIVQIAGIADSPTASLHLSRSAADALRTYIELQQSHAGIAPSERVELDVVNKAGGTKVFAARKKTLPIVVFLTVLLATIALAFGLENLRPRIRAADVDQRFDGPTRTERIKAS
jgi:hypothetical protein